MGWVARRGKERASERDARPALLEPFARAFQAAGGIRHARPLIGRLGKVDSVLALCGLASSAGEELLATGGGGGLGGSSGVRPAKAGLEGLFADADVDAVLLDAGLDGELRVRLYSGEGRLWQAGVVCEDTG